MNDAARDGAEQERSGLQTAIDVTIAPRTAFANLRAIPTWGWAFLISTVLGVIAALAISPIVAHVLGQELPARLAASPQFAQIPADKRAAVVAQQVGIAQTISRFSFVFVPFGLALGSALQALVMLVANAVGKGDGTFKKFWALAVNAAVVGTGISSVALMLIVLIRGADGFGASTQIANAIPGLGNLVPAGAKAAAAFFGVLNVFALWNAVLLALGMTIVARLSRPTAAITAFVLLLGAGLVPLLGAVLQK